MNTFVMSSIIAEKMMKEEVQREKTAGKIEDELCPCQTSKTKETYVKFSSCMWAWNDYS